MTMGFYMFFLKASGINKNYSMFGKKEISIHNKNLLEISKCLEFFSGVCPGFELFMEEKRAWELGNEVYKCDNSKLLSEVNRMKLELLSKERTVQTENAGELKDELC